MYKQTLFIGKAAHLSLRYAQLMIRFREEEGKEKSYPIEDLAYVVLEHKQITLTHGLLGYLSEKNVMLITCNTDFLPNGALLPLAAHCLQSKRFALQIEVKKTLKKQLWKQTIEAKIAAQAATLNRTIGQGGFALQELAKSVKSGDSQNVEGQAANYYWKMLFGFDFIRHRNGAWPNPLLNYGYALIRAGMARALAGAGLLNTLGIHHHNQYNAFCLADDLMEPFRPFVDLIVYHLYCKGSEIEALQSSHKAALLKVFTMDITQAGERSTVGNALKKTAQSLALCYQEKNSDLLSFPTF